MLEADVAWSQITGGRKTQQDFAAILSWPNRFRLLLLADGMGGHNAGDVASKLVVNSFRNHFIDSDVADIRQRLIKALGVANQELKGIVSEQPDLEGMGTTLVAATYDGKAIQWVSVGDSPMWLIRSGQIMRINQNHSMAALLEKKVENGQMTEAEASTSPLRSQLLEAVMGEEIELLDAPEEKFNMEQGDWLIIASDGVETVSEEAILKISQQANSSPAEFVALLLNAVNDVNRPSQDNATVVAMYVSDLEADKKTDTEPVTKDFTEEKVTKWEK